MKVRTDDLLHRVDRTWLGPKILRFPWTATYQAYGVGLLTTAAVAFIGIKIGLPINVVTVMGWIVVSLLTTRKITRSLDPDRPIRAAVARFWGELTAPRPVTPETESAVLVLTVERWRFDAEPERRRLVRWWLACRSAVSRAVGAALMRLGGVGAVVGRLFVRGGQHHAKPGTKIKSRRAATTPPANNSRPAASKVTKTAKRPARPAAPSHAQHPRTSSPRNRDVVQEEDQEQDAYESAKAS